MDNSINQKGELSLNLIKNLMTRYEEWRKIENILEASCSLVFKAESLEELSATGDYWSQQINADAKIASIKLRPYVEFAHAEKPGAALRKQNQDTISLFPISEIAKEKFESFLELEIENYYKNPNFSDYDY